MATPSTTWRTPRCRSRPATCRTGCRRAQVYALGLVFFAIGYLGLGLLDSGPLVLVVLVLYGGFNGCTDGVGKAWISSLAPTEQRGRAQGAYQGFSGGAILIAGIWAGLLWNVGPGGGRGPAADQRQRRGGLRGGRSPRTAAV